MKLTAFETELPVLLALVPQASRAPARKKPESFRDVHARIPFLVASEGLGAYGTDDFDQTLNG